MEHRWRLDEPRFKFSNRGTLRYIKCFSRLFAHICCIISLPRSSANFILEVSLISFQFELWIIYLDLISKLQNRPRNFNSKIDRNFFDRNFRRSHDGSHD